MTTDVATLKAQASSLLKENRFEEALPIYEALWTQHRDECNEWDARGYAQCLRKTGRSAAALEVCREVYRQYPDFQPIRDLYGWCIYDLHIKRDGEQIQQDEATFFKAANAITRLTTHRQYSPYARTVFKVLAYLKSRPSYPAAKILEWTNKLQPDQLSKKPQPFEDSEGNSKEYASDRERWYADRCKALLELQRYEECITLGQQALADIPRFHQDRDIWVKRAIALSKGQLGDKESAISELQALLTRKPDWFIQKEVAQFQYELGKVDDALRSAAAAALAPGELHYKWGLFLLMAQMLQTQGKKEEAAQHVLLAAKVRQEKEWPMTAPLQTAINDFGVDVTASVSVPGLVKELKPMWRSLRFAAMPQAEGVIQTLLGVGKSGFIHGDNGQDYYFKAQSFQGPKERIQPGLRVRFYVEKSSDPTKRDNAVYIEEIRP